MSSAGNTEDFEDLYETAPCGYLSICPNGRIAKINQTLINWLGASDGYAFIGKSLHDILGFGGRIAFETHLAPLLRLQGHVDEIALDLVTIGGDKLQTIANAAEKRDDSGAHQFTRLTLFKATERRTFERNLLDARDQAEAESKEHREAALLRDQFIAVLGHDLRNPLAALSAGVGLVGRNERLSDRGNLVVKEMAASLDRASALVEDLLDLARGSLGGGFPVNRNADAPLAPVLEQVVSEMRRIAPDRVIESTIEIDEPVSCDRQRLAQLASNLLANAITHGDPDRPVRFNAVTTGDLFRMSVANAGLPIPDDVQAHLFQPFFRGATRVSRNGLGLGLYISSEIAKAHGGTLTVDSDASETRFTFEMQASA